MAQQKSKSWLEVEKKLEELNLLLEAKEVIERIKALQASLNAEFGRLEEILQRANNSPAPSDKG